MNLASVKLVEVALEKPKRRYQSVKRRVHPEKASFQVRNSFSIPQPVSKPPGVPAGC
jgi:hypothetical protein